MFNSFYELNYEEEISITIHSSESVCFSRYQIFSKPQSDCQVTSYITPKYIWESSLQQVEREKHEASLVRHLSSDTLLKAKLKQCGWPFCSLGTDGHRTPVTSDLADERVNFRQYRSPDV